MAQSKNDNVDPRIFRMMAEQTLDYALFVLAPDGRVMTWSAGAERLKGYFADEIVGQHFSKFYSAESVARGWPQYELEMAAQQGRFEDEGWRIRKDGSRFWAFVVITALRDENGNLLGFSKVTRDLTERKMHEEALRQSEERFRLLIEGVADYAIYMLDTEGIISSWNTGAERIKGYPREEVIGTHFSRFYTPEDAAAGRPWQELATARNTGRAEDEGWRVKKDGSRFWARVVVTALYDSEGHHRGFAKVTQDLTERRHIQDLERAAKNVSEFIATLAHELRNPLAPIRSAVQVMTKLPADDPAQEAMREMIDRQSSHLTRIVDDMIDIARISRGSIAIERHPVDMEEVIRRSVEAAGPQIESSGHRLHLDCKQRVLVEGDVDRLTQILTNLLNNAARYTPRGGEITITCTAESGLLYLKVRDTGRGITPDMAEQIFDMFVQGRAAIQRIGGGLGIGLALSRRLAELHGGTLSVRSEGENKGSEFTLTLPVLAGYAAGRDEAPHHKLGELKEHSTRKRLLVVDDNVDAATSLALLLRSLGHETLVVHDGRTALKAAEQFAPDVVLLDIGMPEMDGYEIARRLQALKRQRDFQIVAVTGWGQELDRQRSKDAGFDVHLVKPVNVQELEAVFSPSQNTTLH